LGPVWKVVMGWMSVKQGEEADDEDEDDVEEEGVNWKRWDSPQRVCLAIITGSGCFFSLAELLLSSEGRNGGAKFCVRLNQLKKISTSPT
jgi:hypothetical protein